MGARTFRYEFDILPQKAEIIWHNRLNFFPFSKIGKWWDKNEEIDLVVVNPELHRVFGHGGGSQAGAPCLLAAHSLKRGIAQFWHFKGSTLGGIVGENNLLVKYKEIVINTI